MKVLYLVPQPKQRERLTAYTFLDEEIRGLADAGIEAYVLSTKAPRDARVDGIEVRAMPKTGRLAPLALLAADPGAIPLANLRDPRQLYRSLTIERAASALVEAEGIDIVHSHFGWPGSFGGLLTRRATGRPLVASVRGAEILIDRENAHGRRLSVHHDRTIRRLLASADRTVYFSRFMRDSSIALGAVAQRARVVRKGVDLARFAPAADAAGRAAIKRRLGLPVRPMILTVAGLVRNKGVHHVLDAAARLARAHDFSLVICGEGAERDALERQSSALGLDGRTDFRGRVERDAIADYFSACDVLVLASTLEAAGNVLLEAMGAARPVVCTASGGPAEYVRDGETGFVVPVGDTARLAARLQELIADPVLADRLGACGHELARREHGFERMTAELMRIYHEVMAARSPEIRRLDGAAEEGRRARRLDRRVAGT